MSSKRSISRKMKSAKSAEGNGEKGGDDKVQYNKEEKEER